MYALLEGLAMAQWTSEVAVQTCQWILLKILPLHVAIPWEVILEQGLHSEINWSGCYGKLLAAADHCAVQEPATGGAHTTRAGPFTQEEKPFSPAYPQSKHKGWIWS